MSIIIKRYVQDNWSNIFFRILIILYSIPTFLIYKSDNTLLVKTISYIVVLSAIVLLLILCYYKNSEFKITISGKDLIKLNINKKYQYQKLIKEEKYNYVKYIKNIDENIQLEIFNDLNTITIDSYFSEFSLDIYLLNLINPCYEIVYKSIEIDIKYFNYINDKCNDYNKYKELYEFMTI